MYFKKKILSAKLFVSVLALGWAMSCSAGEVSSYELEEMLIEGTAGKDYFGNDITEQSYYRTGGDVKVIDRKTIEKRSFVQLSDALRSIPGVMVKTPGYRGGEYGYAQTHAVVTINGDDKVVVLVDGRRMDNAAGGPISGNSGSSSKAMVDINQIIGINNVEKIEVVKGPGASFYGSDATGGVINIITRRGALKESGSLEIGTGSWKRHNYRLNYSGSADGGKLRYFISGSREIGGDSKYKDGITGNNYTYVNTGYKDHAVNVGLDYDFNKRRSLKFSFNHLGADDGYPLTAPNWTYMDAENWQRIKDGYFKDDKYGDPRNPGYRNLWYMWAATGGYNAYNKNNTDITFVFDRDKYLESFVRVYNQNEKHWGSFGGGDDPDAPTPNTPEWYAWAKKKYRGRDHRSWFHHLKNRGVQVQIGKRVGNNDLLTSWTFDKSRYVNISMKTKKRSYVERESILGYLQGKFRFGSKFEITPSLRYSNYSTFDEESKDGVQSTSGTSSDNVTPSLSAQYAFNDKLSTYLGWSRVYRPLRVGDYKRTNPGGTKADLRDEEGDVYTVGVRAELSPKTSASLHYDYTNMSNAVARYSVWDSSLSDFKLKYVNAGEVKRSFNANVEHKFDDHLTLTAAYSRADDKWSAKDGMTFDPELDWSEGNVNSVINKLRPANVYTADLVYENRGFSTSLTGNYYTGCYRGAYTDKRFMVLDLKLSYDINKDMSVYGSVTNLTNEAWQNVYTNYLGMGAWPQPGRCFLVGMKYRF